MDSRISHLKASLRFMRWAKRTIATGNQQFRPRSVSCALVALLALSAASALAQSKGPVVKVTSPVRLQSVPTPAHQGFAPNGPQPDTSASSESSPTTGISGFLRKILPKKDRTPATRERSRLEPPFLPAPSSAGTARVDDTEGEEIPRRVEPVTSRITDVKPAPVVPVEIRLTSSEWSRSSGEQDVPVVQRVASDDAGRSTIKFRSRVVGRIVNPSRELPPAPQDNAAEDPELGKAKARFVRREVDRLQRLASSKQPPHSSDSDIHEASDADTRGVLISFLRNATYNEEQWPAVASVIRVRSIAVAQDPNTESGETAPTDAEQPKESPRPVEPTIVHAVEIQTSEPAEPTEATMEEPSATPDDSDIAQTDEGGGGDELSQSADLNEDGLKPISEVTLDIRPEEGELPRDLAAAKFLDAGEVRHLPGTNRPWPLYEFWWEAPAVCHRPLYFEEVNLERYGYSYGRNQPFLSGAHFFGKVLALPYLMTAEPHRDCVYTLGHYPPGSYAPYHLHYPPPSLRAAAVEGAVVTGLIFAIP